jgi:hypothetical protein
LIRSNANQTVSFFLTVRGVSYSIEQEKIWSTILNFVSKFISCGRIQSPQYLDKVSHILFQLTAFILEEMMGSVTFLRISLLTLHSLLEGISE